MEFCPPVRVADVEALGTILFFRRFQGAIETYSDGTRWFANRLRLKEETMPVLLWLLGVPLYLLPVISN
jgi:hypothetical protein